MAEISLTLPAVPESIPLARHTLDRLSGTIEHPLLENLRLLVSEVVTNSIRHGHGGRGIELRVLVTLARVRVEVENHGPGFTPETPARGLEREAGWGLLLVDRLADRWGVVANHTTQVWFEIDHTVSPA